MEKSLRRFNLIFAMTGIKPEWFYVIRLHSDEVRLQGKFSKEVCKYLCGLKRMSRAIDKTTGYIEFYAEGINITLT